jgi:hypothetical protein
MEREDNDDAAPRCDDRARLNSKRSSAEKNRQRRSERCARRNTEREGTRQGISEKRLIGCANDSQNPTEQRTEERARKAQPKSYLLSLCIEKQVAWTVRLGS